MIMITTERPEHEAAIEALLDAAFGADRHAKISYTFRGGVDRVMALSLVALDAEGLAATIRYWPILIGETPSLLLGPVAVDAGRRNHGVGATLIRRSLERARILGYRSAVLVGDEAYYGRFGFAPAARHGIGMPRENPARVLARPLGGGTLAAMPTGVILPWRSVRGTAAQAA
jgi:predicted N-acetyltransferase YhbS